MSPEAWFGPWWPYVFILFAGWLATDMWRYLGVLVAARIDEDSAVFVYVKAIATALVAGVIARLVLFPDGSLGVVPLPVRLAAVAMGFAVYWFGWRSVLVGLVASQIVLIACGLYLGL